MAGLKLSIHPLFFIFGLYFALTGKVFSFIIFTLTACIHEYGHYLQSEKCGYKLNKITLMPYGAILSGDLSNLKYVDECKIALAGPITNCFIALTFVALWWFIPDIYPYTELIVMANASIAIVNLIPAYPLDGGRFLNATLSLFLKRKTAKKIVKTIGVLLSLFLLALFIYSCFSRVNLSLLFFALFAFIGAVSENEKNRYIKIYDSYVFDLKTPKRIVKIAVDCNNEVKALYPYITGDNLYEVTVYCGSKKVAVLGAEKLYDLLTKVSGYESLRKVLNLPD
jgi:stage IV sporulation protein FB